MRSTFILLLTISVLVSIIILVLPFLCLHNNYNYTTDFKCDVNKLNAEIINQSNDTVGANFSIKDLDVVAKNLNKVDFNRLILYLSNKVGNDVAISAAYESLDNEVDKRIFASGMRSRYPKFEQILNNLTDKEDNIIAHRRMIDYQLTLVNNIFNFAIAAIVTLAFAIILPQKGFHGSIQFCYVALCLLLRAAKIVQNWGLISSRELLEFQYNTIYLKLCPFLGTLEDLLIFARLICLTLLVYNLWKRQQHILPPGKVEDETITGYVVTTIISSAILTAGGVMLRIMLTGRPCAAHQGDLYWATELYGVITSGILFTINATLVLICYIDLKKHKADLKYIVRESAMRESETKIPDGPQRLRVYIKVLLLLFVSNYIMFAVNYAMSWAEVTTYTDPTYILIILGSLVCTNSSLLLLVLLSQEGVQRGLKNIVKYWETRIENLKDPIFYENEGAFKTVKSCVYWIQWKLVVILLKLSTWCDSVLAFECCNKRGK
ncbi:uncharacterized protein LOC118434141 [Folsomia candida]|uniref:uncharacterized protein LOC118434141 n=1 Tax=Folsomia candida TaxID=158441 RepID=UPI001604A6F7|nr:uncharacterized protein LOC118434141 [Folsomia candida]